MKVRCVVLGATKDLIGRCLFNCRLHFQICFFLLDSIEDKDSRFISDEQFHLMVSVSLPTRI